MSEKSQVNYYAVISAEDLPAGERLFLEVGGKPIVMFNIAGHYFAIGDVCTHDDGPLGDGELTGFEIKCPRHGARFDVRDGQALSRPAVVAAPSYPVRVVDGMIELGI